MNMCQAPEQSFYQDANPILIRLHSHCYVKAHEREDVLKEARKPFGLFFFFLARVLISCFWVQIQKFCEVSALIFAAYAIWMRKQLSQYGGLIQVTY